MKQSKISYSENQYVHVTQIFIFCGEEYLGWDCFQKDSIAIGRSEKADLILDDKNIAAFQAIVFYNEDKIYVDLFENKSNRKTTVCLDKFDSVDIGSYTLKIKRKAVSERSVNNPDAHKRTEQQITVPRIQQENIEPKEKEAEDAVLAEQAKAEDPEVADTVDLSKIEPVEAETNIKEIKTEPAGKKTQNEGVEDRTIKIEKPIQEGSKKQAGSVENKTIEIDFKTKEPKKVLELSQEEYDANWEDEDEDDDIEAFFSLREKIIENSNSNENRRQSSNKDELLIEVIKIQNDKVYDVSFLSTNQKYFIENENSRFCLAENKKNQGQYIYFQGHHHGMVQIDKSEEKPIEKLCTANYIFHKRKKIYRHFLPKNGIAVICDDTFEYRLKTVQPEESPTVRVPQKNDNIFFKHIVKSSVLHLFFLVFVGLFPGFKPPENPPETHFVQIDTNELEKIQRQIHPPKPKIISPPKKTASSKPVLEKRKITKKKTTKKRKAKRQVASRHPKAGGGFGKGNIKNRNINQTGILSMLGSSVGLKPGEAMAAVTNLDAISNSSNNRGAFKISDITGKLGNGKIEMPTSDIVTTKGSLQVLRSAGAGGKGRVAALKKGKTGQNKVMAMVTASLNKKVRIQGGMSREAVKRIIDMHIDEISYCYETALVDNPSIIGRMVFEWKILLSGRVGEVRIKNSSINSDYIHSCIKSKIKSWQFPKPTGSEVLVSYPFIFDIVGF